MRRCFSQSGFSNGRWRLYGGAGIILSRGMVRQIQPNLVPYFHKLDGSTGAPKKFLLDLALPEYIEKQKHTFYNLQGLYSQTPGFYLTTPEGKRDAPGGLSRAPITFHYVRGAYVDHLHLLATHLALCGHGPHGGADGSRPSLASSLALADAHHNGRKSSGNGQVVVVGMVGAQNMQVAAERAKVLARGLRMVPLATKCVVFALGNLLQQVPGADWYMLVHPDVYLVAENVQHVVAQRDPGRRILVGGPGSSSTASSATAPNLNSGIVVSRTAAETLTGLEPGTGERHDHDKHRACNEAGLVRLAKERSVQIEDDAGLLSSLAPVGMPETRCVASIPLVGKFPALKPKHALVEAQARLTVVDYFINGVARGFSLSK